MILNAFLLVIDSCDTVKISEQVIKTVKNHVLVQMRITRTIHEKTTATLYNNLLRISLQIHHTTRNLRPNKPCMLRSGS